MAMNTAGSTVVGQNLAAGEFSRVKKVLKSLAEITITVSTFFSVLIVLFPEEIFSLFIKTTETDVLSIAKKLYSNCNFTLLRCSSKSYYERSS